MGKVQDPSQRFNFNEKLGAVIAEPATRGCAGQPALLGATVTGRHCYWAKENTNTPGNQRSFRAAGPVEATCGKVEKMVKRPRRARRR